MRKFLTMILVAGGLSFFSPFSASALPASGAAVERAVGAESPVEQAYYYRRYHYYRPYRHYYRPHYHYYRPYYRPYRYHYYRPYRHYYRPYYHRRHYW
jgi:hypothetical protein